MQLHQHMSDDGTGDVASNLTSALSNANGSAMHDYPGHPSLAK
jgi:hypothetical protein